MKVLLFLPDGIGIRNFIYTDFLHKAKENNIEVTVLVEKILLNAIENDVRKLELPSHKTSSSWIELMKKSWEIALLKYQSKKFNAPVYLSYIFKKKRTNAQKVKAIFEYLYVSISKNSAQKVAQLKVNYLEATKKLDYYKACKELLQNEKPDIIFCTHRRSLKAVAPLLAAKELEIKNVLPYSIVGGNPAKEIKKRFSENIINELLELKWWDLSNKEIEKLNPLFFSDLTKFNSIYEIILKK